MYVYQRNEIISTLAYGLECIIIDHKARQINAESIFEKVEARLAAAVIPTMNHKGFEVENRAGVTRPSLALHGFEKQTHAFTVSCLKPRSCIRDAATPVAR